MSAGGGGAVETRFVYDAAGRRVREERADGGVRVFAWGALARLESVSIDGALEKRRVSLLTDALGELTAVDGAYSWAGNNPVGMSDPSRRHPLTDAEFASWRDSHRTGLAAAGDRVAACDPVTGEALARTVTATAPTGRTQRVYSFEVDGLQAYYVRAGTTFIAVHNECSELARQLQRRASSGVDRVQEVIRETAESRSKSFTSRYGLTQSEALEAGE